MGFNLGFKELRMKEIKDKCVREAEYCNSSTVSINLRVASAAQVPVTTVQLLSTQFMHPLVTSSPPDDLYHCRMNHTSQFLGLLDPEDEGTRSFETSDSSSQSTQFHIPGDPKLPLTHFNVSYNFQGRMSRRRNTSNIGRT